MATAADVKLIGTTAYSIDRGRVPIPPQFRKLFDPVAYVTNGALKCVLVYTPDGYDAEEKKVDAWPSHLEEAKLAFFAATAPKTLDSQGRISLDPVHTEHAGIKRDVLVIGNRSELQIWDKATWDSRAAERERAAHMARFGELKPSAAPAVVVEEGE
jgi:division/cell wall cluster transcriptional repressor MraZ